MRHPGECEMRVCILSKSVYESELLAGVALWEHFSGREMGDGRFQGVFRFSTLNPERLEVYVEEVCPCMSSPPREGGCRSAPAWAGVPGSGIGPYGE